MTRSEWKAVQEGIPSYQERVEAVVASGACPRCGGGIHRNLALSGWWQCDQYGETIFRKQPGLPECSWQGFTS